MMVTSANDALPIQRLAPLSTQEFPSRWARVSSATASEPWFGSVRPKAPIFSIVAIAGSHCCFCSSEPSMWIEVIARPEWTPKKVQTLASPRQLQRDEAGRDGAHPWATVALEAAAGDVESGQLGNQLKGKLGALPVAVDDGNHLAVAESADLVAYLALLRAEEVVHVIIVGAERGGDVLRVGHHVGPSFSVATWNRLCVL